MPSLENFLTRDELPLAITYLQGKKDLQTRCNLAIFRLSCCCGLRTIEIQGLNLGDFNFSRARPVINVPADITKGKNGKRRSRVVPLWWDNGTLSDLKGWYDFRMSEAEKLPDKIADQPFVCGVGLRSRGKRFHRTQIAKKWATVMRQVLGPERARQLSIHSGRHTFISWSLAMGRSPQEVMLAAGHRSLSTTTVYAHPIEDTRGLPDVFGL